MIKLSYEKDGEWIHSEHDTVESAHTYAQDKDLLLYRLDGKGNHFVKGFYRPKPKPETKPDPKPEPKEEPKLTLEQLADEFDGIEPESEGGEID